MAQAASGSTSLVRLLGTAPLIQAPMAGVQDGRLAAAVCNAGALGSLPAAMLGADALCADGKMSLADHQAFAVGRDGQG